MSKNRFFITIFLLLFSVTTVAGQNISKILNRQVKKLQKQGADTILVYLSGCGGCEIKHKPTSCTCFDPEGIVDVSLIFKIKGQIYREDFTCCKKSSLIKMDSVSSIPFFLSLSDMLRKKDEYYVLAAKKKTILPSYSYGYIL